MFVRKDCPGGSWYDHIWVDLQHTGAELTDEAGVGTPAENSSGGGRPSSLEEASDPCPVWAVFTTTDDDDPVCE